ncbi:MAG: metallophosphoesterase [Acidobacteria bacterium]|nr:metallophosphoesterase [Acidobacteriota bacterium]
MNNKHWILANYEMTMKKFQTIFRLHLVFIVVFGLLVTGIIAGATAQNEDTFKAHVTFAVIGDAGSGDEAQYAVSRQMFLQRSRFPFDFTLMLGDNIYERGESKYIVPRFESPNKDLLAAGVLFYAVLGNHDIVKGLEFQTHYKNFNMGGRRYYNFTKGDGLVEFFALDSNKMSKEQLAWLETSLKSSSAKWKVAFLHHSLYSSARMHPAYVDLRKQLEPLFVKYGVNAVFSGHSHCYERVKPQNGVHYFTEGASGEIKRNTLDRKSTLMAAGEDGINSFIIVQVNENEMRVQAIGSDGRTIDTQRIAAKRAN